MFKFKSTDAKLLFWGINGLLVFIFMFDPAGLLESPEGLGFPVWIAVVIMSFVAWVLAKFTDRDSNQ